MKTRTEQIILRAAAVGSVAESPKGAAKFLLRNFDKPYTRPTRTVAASVAESAERKRGWLLDRRMDGLRPGQTISLKKWAPPSGYRSCPRTDADAAARARDAIGTRNQRSNFGAGYATCDGEPHQARYETIAYGGRHRGRTGSYLYWDYQSSVAISRSGKSAMVILECVLLRRIIAPKGMCFSMDGNGILIRRTSDGMDYHPSPTDWAAKNFVGLCRAGMAANFGRRREVAKLQRGQALAAKIKAREIGTCRVTLEDSRRAGNCIEGSLRFAERVLGLSREALLAAGHLLSVPASRLRTRAGADAAGVQRAIESAWARETMVQI